MASSDGFPAILPDDPSSLPVAGPSAFVGQPPATQNDYYIVKGLFRMMGMVDANPMAGYFLSAKPPTDYVHETRVTSVLTGLIFVVLAIVVPTAARIGLRLRRGSTMQFGWDDWTLVLAALLALVYPVTQITSIAVGAAALHQWEVTYEQYNFGMVVAMTCKTTFYVAVGMIKLSIALFIRRMADRLNRWLQLACDVFMASLVGFMLLAIFYNVFACDPPAIQWDLALRGRLDPVPKCIDLGVQSKVLSGIHVAQGIALLLTPIAILWKVRMQRAKKIRLFVIWTIGGLTVMGGLLRQIRPTMTNDFTWDYVEVLVWTCLDLSFGILTACLPVLDGLFEKCWRRAKSSVANTYGTGQSRDPTDDGAVWQYSKTSDLDGSRQSRRHVTKTSVSIITQRRDRSESSESIVKRDHLHVNGSGGGMEMNILRTQEVEVHVTTAEEDPSILNLDPRAPSPQWHNRPEWHEQPKGFKFRKPES
ncbi:integral membrane protein [Colletotrichum plurivorum]|uniref:Integral membrane protein n=1 Tax=Colletotrichum plurivorum TaxID=2175906 RepID=A0A8H6KF70_9PEZI|nr:integral membrane protein [Colletotrichum plurivorum]